MSTQAHADAYRSVLLTALEERCQRNPRYSQRAFARDLGLAPHRVSEILRGRQGLSRQSADAIASKLGLSEVDRQEFLQRVAAAHGRSTAERKLAAAQLQQRERQESHHKVLSLARFKAIATWYHLAIVEALKLAAIDPTARGLAARLGIATASARMALRRLTALGLVQVIGKRAAKTDADHVEARYEPIADAILGGDVPSAAVRSFHQQYLEKAQQALVLQDFEQRQFMTSVLAIDRQQLPKIKKRIEGFVEELSAEFGALPGDGRADAVYALAAQIFRVDVRPD